MKRLFTLLTLSAVAAFQAGAAEEHGQLDGNITLFSVLAALNASGYDTELNSTASHPLRVAIRQELAKNKVPVISDLKYFVSKHHKDNPAADLGQYISFALSVKGPPNFDYRFRKVDLPPDVEPLEGFAGLMARFYDEAGIAELWKKSQPAYDREIERYHEPVAQEVLRVNSYLRNVTSGYLGRRFQIYLDLLGAPNQVQVRNYVDDYFVVVTPSPEPRIADIRNAYLGYLLEAPAAKYSDLILKNRGLIDFVQNAPALPEVYKSDFLLLTTRSLIKAIDSRLAPSGQRQRIVDEALREGYILTPHFAEQLPVYETQQAAMRMYFPELIKSIDLPKEEKRLEAAKFAPGPVVHKAASSPSPEPAPPELSPAQKALEEAENLYRDRDLEKAKQAYSRLLGAMDEHSVHASSYYGLARIAVLQRDPELAERLFQKSLESSPDPPVRAWAEVYLGRLSDAAGERAEAIGHYKRALAVAGGSAAARDAAQKGIEQSFRK